jgi:uncharacterized membrane-anchored protein YitT (DUF2179 family)
VKTASSSISIVNILWIELGAFLAAIAIEFFFIPNNLIDSGVVGLSMILDSKIDAYAFPFLLIALNLPMIYIAYKHLGKIFVFYMVLANVLFGVFASALHGRFAFHGDVLEVVVSGGILMGVGIGIIIRNGTCLDGSEIFAILMSKKHGYSIGQIIIFINLFVFAAAGVIYKNWHVALQSFITYLIAVKLIDMIVVGLDEMKAVMIISRNPEKIAHAIIEEMGITCTLIHGRGGFSHEDRQIIYVTVERLQLADLKEIIYAEDSRAFVTIHNLHEVLHGEKIYHQEEDFPLPIEQIPQ